jgi:hypothetical protein
MDLGRDGRNLDGCILLAVSPATLSTCLRLVHEANNLWTLSGSYDLSRNLGTSQRSLARHHIGAVNDEKWGERNARTHCFAQELNIEHLAGFDLVLLATGFNHCVHKASRLHHPLGALPPNPPENLDDTGHTYQQRP